MTLEGEKPHARARLLDRVLALSADVRAGEGRRALLLACNLFFLLFGYYLLKTIREPLILGVRGGGAEVKAYAAASQAMLLVGISIAFGWLAGRVSRMRLITAVTLFFTSNLVLFFALFSTLPQLRLILGIAFFIWVGCFNVMIVAQFWAFANDLHSQPEGERLFPLIAGGSALGAVAGAKLAKPLFDAFGPFALMLVAAGLLLVCLVFTWRVNRREPVVARASIAASTEKSAGGFSLILRDRYLMVVGLLSLLKNWVNSTGEYILDRRLVEVARLRIGGSGAAVQRYIAAFKSDYFTYVNVTVMVLQLFAVSRIIRALGVRRSLFVLPLVSLSAYGTMAVVPILGVILAGKIAENSIDYSLQKTSEQMLFLVTSRPAKYKAKAVIDTFMVRLGDVFAAALVWVGARLGFATLTFIVAQTGLVGGWLVLVTLLARTHRRREAGGEAQATGAASLWGLRDQPRLVPASGEAVPID